MSAKCQVCAATAQLFLCESCADELRDMLTGLPRLIEHLAEAAVGHTRLGDEGRRTPRYRQPLDGDAELASQIEPYPNDDEPDLAKARRQRQEAALRHALARGRVNLRAAELRDYVHSVLVEWVRDICETHGAQTPIGHASSQLALWLADNVTAIAADQAAGVCHREIRQIIGDIERVINRPIPPRLCGMCEAVVNHDPCNTALYAHRDAIEVTCPICKTSHNVEQVQTRALNAADHQRFTSEELLGSRGSESHGILGRFDEAIPRSTFFRWVRDGTIRPSGYRSADGRRISLTKRDPADRPVYRLADVRRARAANRNEGVKCS